jgi:signal transduction histidine kinase
VIDTGVGISPEDQKRLFKLFGCLTSSHKINPQGIGLGLYISKLITEQFGGKCSLESQLEIGSKFTFNFTLNNLLESQKEQERIFNPEVKNYKQL